VSTQPPAAPRPAAQPGTALTGLTPGAPVAVVVTGDGLALASAAGSDWLATHDPATELARLDAEARPRWVWWSAREALAGVLAARPDLRLTRCWDLAAVHRLLHGGAADDPSQAWAAARGLDPATVPQPGRDDQLDLVFGAAAPATVDPGEPDDPDSPLQPDGHLRAGWAHGGWTGDPDRALTWARLALDAQQRQQQSIAEVGAGGDVLTTAWSESAAALLAEELAAGGLPVDVPEAERVVAGQVGPRPRDAAHAAELRRHRDQQVLRLVQGAGEVDLRSPQQVRTLLAGLGLDVPDTRSWRLERLREAHPVVTALLAWREADRYATTYGYRWLDEHVVAGRLRGRWSASDGGAGRMTAQAGLHSLPAALRTAVRAEPGHLLVRADLGQVEPRVLAAVSGDQGLARAAEEPDLYAPVAARLGVERAVAKIAVLAAMYGQTSGAAGQALAGMERGYPTAMRYLQAAHDAGRRGQPVRTYGGRLVRMWTLPGGDVAAPELSPAEQAAHRSAVAARGRFARNAVVQGSAAELFKAWAAVVRLRLAGLGGEVVLCLHDELLLQVPADRAQDAVRALHEGLGETAARWCRGPRVRFVADVAVVERWSDAKG